MLRIQLLIVVVLMQCGTAPVPEPATQAGPVVFTPGGNSIRILFVGNSLTYANDLPALVVELGAMEQVSITYKMIAPGGYSLEDHWNKGEVQKEMSSNHYDVVVGQQGPSALPESQVLLKMYAGKYAGECAKLETPWALYMVWPSEQRSFDLDNVIYSYTEAAKSTSALLFPAGLAWKLGWAKDPTLPLYGSDRFHPSVTGSLLAAMTIYAVLQGKTNFNFIDYDDASWRHDVSAAQLAVMKESALEAIRAN